MIGRPELLNSACHHVRFKSSPQPSSFTSSKPYDAAAAADFSITARTASEFGDPVYRSRQMQLFRYLLSQFHVCPWAPQSENARACVTQPGSARTDARTHSRAHTLACAHTGMHMRAITRSTTTSTLTTATTTLSPILRQYDTAIRAEAAVGVTSQPLGHADAHTASSHGNRGRSRCSRAVYRRQRGIWPSCMLACICARAVRVRAHVAG